jgi:hypothetical protein
MQERLRSETKRQKYSSYRRATAAHVCKSVGTIIFPTIAHMAEHTVSWFENNARSIYLDLYSGFYLPLPVEIMILEHTYYKAHRTMVQHTVSQAR